MSAKSRSASKKRALKYFGSLWPLFAMRAKSERDIFAAMMEIYFGTHHLLADNHDRQLYFGERNIFGASIMRGKTGRKRLDPKGDVGVCVRLPAVLLDRLDRYAAGEFCSRQV